MKQRITHQVERGAAVLPAPEDEDTLLSWIFDVLPMAIVWPMLGLATIILTIGRDAATLR